MKVKIYFSKKSWYYQSGEKSRTVKNLIEVHYNYGSIDGRVRTAFECSDTGFTLFNDDIEQFEIVETHRDFSVIGDE